MYIYLDIVKAFSCEMCGSCCRKEWSVTLNEESYQRNSNLFMATNRGEEFEKIFIPLAEKSGLDEYAYIRKKASGGCWFLAEDHHCRLQREAGHDHLDHVCQIYPRYPMNTARGTELTLSFSCPAVIKLASRMEPLRIIRSEHQPIHIEPNHDVVYVYPQQQSASNPLRYYFEIEQHFIDIMQSRSLEISERLQIIIETAQKIKELPQDDVVGQQLNKIFYDNYELLDAKMTSEEVLIDKSADILLENFFVNFMFKKPFYIYGLQRTRELLLTIWNRIEKGRESTKDSAMDLESTVAIIMEIEFEYSHNRKALF
ncbi:flagellin lysine-N-methylase [Pelosinus sp. sgz500959]|uniref:flagellin lysine-N-methylase n=1 Tax=Pelosinus sp. sgz500959 TaxID=3242472 RepID=UPI00366D4A13